MSLLTVIAITVVGLALSAAMFFLDAPIAALVMIGLTAVALVAFAIVMVKRDLPRDRRSKT